MSARPGAAWMRGGFVAALGLLWLVPSLALAESPPGSCIDVLPEPPRLVPSASSSAGAQGPTVRSFDFTESLPREVPANAPFTGWLVIPTRDEQALREYTARAADYEVSVVTPSGTFRLRVSAVGRVTRVGAKLGVHEGSPQQGVLALLCFDPSGKGPLVYPRASAIETARKAGLLTPEQQRTLAEADKALATRYPALLREWADFAKATYVMPQRTRLLEAFGWLYRLPGEHLYAELEPPHFLDRAQRIQVRRLGEPVPGECSVQLVEGPQPQLSIKARNCPLSELVRAWSNALTHHWPRYREPGLELKATGDRRHEELDLTLQLAQEPRAALRTAAGMLRAIEGLEAARESQAP